MTNLNTAINNYYEDAVNLCDTLNGHKPMNPVLIITKKSGIFITSDLYDNSEYKDTAVVCDSEYEELLEYGLGITYNSETDKYQFKELSSNDDINQYNEDIQYWIDKF
jgi:hypothetical protein